MIETHPFDDFVPPNATCLILGTFPTHSKNWRFNAYYPGRSNFFWRMLSEIYKRPFLHKSGEEAAKERLALIYEKGIALSDTVYQCRRKVAESSKDSDLEILAKMDILKILTNHPSINTVILTGSSGPVSAHHLFYELLHERKIPSKVEGTKIPIHGSFKLKDRVIEVHSLYSTSGLNIGRYAEAVKQYKAVLPK
ncbi:MAG: hypothetical protein U0V74_16120 [Chitinophagales bacterium]